MRPRGITFIAIALVIAALLFLPLSLLTAIGISHTFGLSGTLGSVIDIILAVTALLVAGGLLRLELWAFWGAAMLLAVYALSALYTLFVQHASLFSLHQSLLLSIGGLIYLFADRDVRAAFFNT